MNSDEGRLTSENSPAWLEHFAESGLGKLLDRLGVHVSPDLFDLALTHRSWAYENGHAPHNERLEFLGDAVLGVIVTDHLYRTFPDEPEGQLAKLRAAGVSSVALADGARDLHIGGLIKLGKGEIGTGGDDKTSILADTMEAIIGAIFIGCGMQAASRYVHTLIDPRIELAANAGESLDWKTSLQEIASEMGLPAPKYDVTGSGPDHRRTFSAEAILGDLSFGPGVDSSKKRAEQQAASIAFRELKARQDTQVSDA